MKKATSAEKAIIDTVVAEAINGKVESQQLALDASQLLTISKDRFDDYKNRGFFKRCWYAVNGKHAELSAANQSDLVSMQEFAWRYLSALQEQNLMLGQAIAIVRNNLNKLANAEVETRLSVIAIAKKLDVLKALEGHSAIHGWLLTVTVSGYERHPILHRVLKIAIDFFRIMQNKKISFQDIDVRKYLLASFKDLDLDATKKVTPLELMTTLLEELDDRDGDDLYAILGIKVNDQTVLPSFILENVSGSGYNTPYLLLERLKYLREIKAVSANDQYSALLDAWLKAIAPHPEAQYSLIELAEEIVAGSLLADAIWREQNPLPSEVTFGDSLPSHMELQYEETPPSSVAYMDDESAENKTIADNNAVDRTTDELAANPDLPSSMQKTLLASENESVLIALAKNPALLEEIQTILAKTGSPAVREALARNKCLNKKLQKYLNKTGTENVRRELAQNPALIKELMLDFSNEEERSIRALIASNPSIDAECQAILISHPANDHLYLRGEHPLLVLLSNPSLTDEFMQLMAKSRNVEILHNLALNPSLPLAFIEKFCRHGDSGPQPSNEETEFPKHIAFSDAFRNSFAECDGEDYKVRVGVAQNIALPDSLQRKLIDEKGDESGFNFSGSQTSEIREALASNPALCESAQSQLAQMGSGGFFGGRGGPILINLARNPVLAPAQQAVLADLGDSDVHIALADNPALEKSVRRKIIASFSASDLRIAESNAASAEEISDKLFEKYCAASEKSNYASGLVDIPFFNSAEKKDRLEQESKDAHEKSIEAGSKASALSIKANKIKALLLQQTQK